MQPPSVQTQVLPEEYQKLVETCVRQALELEVEKDWQFVKEQNGVRVSSSSKPGSGGAQIMRGDADLECSMDEFLALMKSIERRKEWDVLVELCRMMEQIDDRSFFIYLLFKTQWPVYPRDLVVFGSSKDLEDGRVIVIGISSKHEKCPEVSGVVRAQLVLSANILKAKTTRSEPGCSVVYLAEINLNGWIPYSVMNRVSTEAPMVLARINELLKQDKQSTPQ